MKSPPPLNNHYIDNIDCSCVLGLVYTLVVFELMIVVDSCIRSIWKLTQNGALVDGIEALFNIKYVFAGICTIAWKLLNTGLDPFPLVA